MKTTILFISLFYSINCLSSGVLITDWKDLNRNSHVQNIEVGKIRKIGKLSEIKLKGNLGKILYSEVKINSKLKVQTIPLIKINSKMLLQTKGLAGTICIEGQKECNDLVINEKNNTLDIVVTNDLKVGKNFIASASIF